MTNIFSGTHYYDDAKNAKNRFHPLLVLLIFFLAFYAIQSIQSTVLLLCEVPMLMEHIGTLGEEPTTELILSQIGTFLTNTPAEYVERSIVIQLFTTLIPAVLAIVYCRFLERRSLRSMGFVKEKTAVVKYLLGMGIGLAAFSAALFIVVLTGNAEYAGLGTISSPLMYLLICLGWIIQGAEEEIICRGWLMCSLSARLPMWAAVLINSAFFSVMHLFNGGFSLLAALNIMLVGIFLSLLAVRTGSIFASCALHSVWNFVQGNLYGLPVSGMATGSSVFRFELSGSELWTGGQFGVESGLGATIVSVVLIALFLLLPTKKKAAE